MYVVLIYDQYDVQPPEPLEHWISPAFEPTICDGNIYAHCYPTMVGTGPMCPLCQTLDIPVASGAGSGYHGSQVHAPNENICLADYWMAMRWLGGLIKAFAEHA